MSRPLVLVDRDWPYFVKPNNSDAEIWYTAKFSGSGWPSQNDLEAVINCINLNARPLLHNDVDLANMEVTPRPQLSELKQIGSSVDDSMKAMFVESRLYGRQIMVCPSSTTLQPIFANSRTNNGEEWPNGSRRVVFLAVHLPPVRKPTNSPVTSLPKIPSAVPAVARGTPRQPFGQAGGGRPVPRALYETPPSTSSVRQLVAQPPAAAARQFGVPQPVAPQAMATAYVHGVNIKVINRDIVKFITTEGVQAVVNAANSQSFIPGDDGISGALRDAMYSRAIYQNCVRMKYGGTLEDERQSLDAQIKLAKMHADAENPVCGSTKYLKSTFDISSQVRLLTETQAAWEPAKGYLKDSGVDFVIHAVGPKWTDTDYTFQQCASRLQTTIENALALAESLKIKSIAFPVISGGLFCHQNNPERDQEQDKAQELLLQVILAHVKKMNQRSTLKDIFIVEINSEQSQIMALRVQAIDERQRDDTLARMRKIEQAGR